MKVATTQLTFIAITVVLVSSVHQTEGTLNTILPTLRNYWTKLWDPNAPATDSKSPVWFVVTHNGQDQININPEHQQTPKPASLPNSYQSNAPNPNTQPLKILPSEQPPALSSLPNQVASGILIQTPNIPQQIPQQIQQTPQQIPQQIQQIPQQIPQQIQQIPQQTPQQIQQIPQQIQQTPQQIPKQIQQIPQQIPQQIQQIPQQIPQQIQQIPQQIQQIPQQIPQQIQQIPQQIQQFPQQIPQQISIHEMPKIPKSFSLWSSLTPSSLPGIPLIPRENPHSYLFDSVNKPAIPYPVVVQPSSWQYHIPALPIQPTEAPPTMQHHTVESDSGFAGLPGKIKAHLTLNYIPPSSAQEIPLSASKPQEETSEPTLKPTTPVDEVGKQDPTDSTVAATHNPMQELVEGSGTAAPDDHKPIDKRTVTWFVHQH